MRTVPAPDIPSPPPANAASAARPVRRARCADRRSWRRSSCCSTRQHWTWHRAPLEVAGAGGRGRAVQARSCPPPSWRSSSRTAATVGEAAGGAGRRTWPICSRRPMRRAAHSPCAGLHPFAARGGAAEPGRRTTRRHARRIRRWSHRRQLVFALQVHVAIRGADRALAVHNAAALPTFPELAALAANAPFHAGRDTGMASARPLVGENLPAPGRAAGDAVGGRRSRTRSLVHRRRRAMSTVVVGAAPARRHTGRWSCVCLMPRRRSATRLRSPPYGPGAARLAGQSASTPANRLAVHDTLAHRGEPLVERARWGVEGDDARSRHRRSAEPTRERLDRLTRRAGARGSSAWASAHGELRARSHAGRVQRRHCALRAGRRRQPSTPRRAWLAEPPRHDARRAGGPRRRRASSRRSGRAGRPADRLRHDRRRRRAGVGAADAAGRPADGRRPTSTCGCPTRPWSPAAASTRRVRLPRASPARRASPAGRRARPALQRPHRRHPGRRSGGMGDPAAGARRARRPPCTGAAPAT